MLRAHEIYLYRAVDVYRAFAARWKRVLIRSGRVVGTSRDMFGFAPVSGARLIAD